MKERKKYYVKFFVFLFFFKCWSISGFAASTLKKLFIRQMSYKANQEQAHGIAWAISGFCVNIMGTLYTLEIKLLSFFILFSFQLIVCLNYQKIYCYLFKVVSSIWKLELKVFQGIFPCIFFIHANRVKELLSECASMALIIHVLARKQQPLTWSRIIQVIFSNFNINFDTCL